LSSSHGIFRKDELVHENPWFSIKNRGSVLRLKRSLPQVQILPIVENKLIIVVRVYRPVITDNTLELLGGEQRKMKP
jgi:hypothetical protein